MNQNGLFLFLVTIYFSSSSQMAVPVRYNATDSSVGTLLNSIQKRRLPGSANLALRKPTYQSSMYLDSPSFMASLAVDGNINTKFHSNDGPWRYGWFVVDLQQQYLIHRVVLTNHPDYCCPARMDNFMVELTNISPLINIPIRRSSTQSLCGQYGKAVRGVGMIVYCNANTPASRYVIIEQSTNEFGWLEISELEVYSYDMRFPTIHLRSYGHKDTPGYERYGFVKVNNHKSFGSSYGLNADPNHRGLNTFIFNFLDYTINDWRRFDTHADVEESKNFVDYYNHLHDGTILIGVTADEPFQHLGPALRLLKVAGVDVYDVGPAGKFAFVLQKGYPEKTVTSKLKADQNVLELNISIQVYSKENVIIKRV